MAIAAMVLGILSVVFNLFSWCIPVAGALLPIVLGAAAIVLSVMAKKREPEKKGFIITGLVLGIVGVAWGVLALICGVFAMQAFDQYGGQLDSFIEETERAAEELEKSMEQYK